MKRALKVAAGVGGLTSVGGPLLALILYPKAKWLFAFVLVGFAVLWLNGRLAKDPTPQALADQIERLLEGNFAGWDVDDFERQGIRSPQLKALYLKARSFGLPEEWINLDGQKKSQLQGIVEELRLKKR